MALPRPKSIFGTLGIQNLGFAVAPTGMQSGNEPDDVSMSAETCDITECSDAKFDEWLEGQKPNLYAQDPVFEHKRFTNEMMQAWMTLSSAATKATAVAINEFLDGLKSPRPEASDYEPQFSNFVGHEPPFQWELDELQQKWAAEQARIAAMKQKPQTLAARAERVQSRISFA